MPRFLLRLSVLWGLQKLFSKTSGDAIAPDEAYKTYGRSDVSKEEKDSNKLWLRNEISKLKQHALITTRLGRINKRKQITHIELTEKGRIALSRVEGKLDTPEPKNGKSQIGDMIQVITALQRENPKIKITMNVNEGTISLQE